MISAFQKIKSFFSLSKNRRNFWLAFLAIGVAVGALGFALPAQAGVGELFGGVVFFIIRQLVDLISVFTTWAMMIAGTLLDYVTSANFNNQPLTHGHIVDIGWSIVRDFANMFFIVILLASAFATMLSLENYNIRKILPTLVIIALLVNFTKVIAGIFVDAAQIIMIWFLTTDGGGSISLTLVHGVGLGQFFTLNGQAISQMTFYQSQSAQLVNSIAYVIFSGYFAMILFFLSVMLILRIAVLWILVIFSPLAFVSYILPNAKFVFDNWWKYFLNYTFFGPVMAFFLFLAVIIAVQIDDLQQWVGYQASEAASIQSTFLTGPFILQYLVVMIFLWRGYKFSQQMSIWGADWGAKQMGKIGDRAKGWLRGGTIGLAWKGIKLGAGALETKYLAKKGIKIWGTKIPLAPRAIYRGIKRAREIHEKQALAESIGSTQDAWNKIVYGRKTFYAQEARQKEVLERKKDKANLGVELNTLLSQLEQEVGAKKINDIDLEATIRLMVENNYEDDLMHWLVATPKGQGLAKLHGIKYADLLEYGTVDPLSTSVLFRRILNTLGIKGETQTQIVADLGEISAVKGGIYGNLALGRYVDENEAQENINNINQKIDEELNLYNDIKDLEYQRVQNTITDQEFEQRIQPLREKFTPKAERRIGAMHWAAKMSTAQQPRTFVGKIHPRTFITYDIATGAPRTDLHRMAEFILARLTDKTIGQEKYINQRTKTEISKSFKHLVRTAAKVVKRPWMYGTDPEQARREQVNTIIKFAKGVTYLNPVEMNRDIQDVIQEQPEQDRELLRKLMSNIINEENKGRGKDKDKDDD